MPSIATDVSIANQALSWLGANQITAFEDEGEEAKYIRANYALLRDAVLEEHWWSFATRRIRLGSEIPNNDPDTAYEGYQFTIPAETIRIWKCANDIKFSDVDSLQWEIMEGFILANADPIFVQLTFRVTDPAKFTTSFTQALAARLASDLCLPITESNKKLESMQALYAMKLDSAKTTDGMQGRSQRIRSSWMRNARARTSNSVG